MRVMTASAVFACVAAASASSHTQAPPPAPTIRTLAATLRGSGCSVNGIDTGDPAKTSSVAVEKYAPGCAIPWHWHTPNEHVMMVSGTFNFEIQGEKPVLVNPGDFVLIPSHRVSQTTCVGPDPCINFLYTDAPMDIHFVDDTSAEISLDQALKNYAKTEHLKAMNDEQQLRDIQQGLARAWVQRDRAFIENVLAPEWSVTQPDGQVLSRSTVLGTFFDSVKIDSSVVDDVTVMPFGDTAVVRGRTVASGTLNGSPVNARVRFTDVFIKRHSKWQAVASHASPLAQ